MTHYLSKPMLKNITTLDFEENIDLTYDDKNPAMWVIIISTTIDICVHSPMYPQIPTCKSSTHLTSTRHPCQPWLRASCRHQRRAGRTKGRLSARNAGIVSNDRGSACAMQCAECSKIDIERRLATSC